MNTTSNASPMKFLISSLEEIYDVLLYPNSGNKQFSKSEAFTFPTGYSKVVAAIKTTEISTETILFDVAEAQLDNRDFENKAYWSFAANGQGDRWMLDENNAVYFYDHNDDEDFLDMQISFEQWLQMAFLIQQLDAFLELHDNISPSLEKAFNDSLNSIHPMLSENYPFEI